MRGTGTPYACDSWAFQVWGAGANSTGAPQCQLRHQLFKAEGEVARVDAEIWVSEVGVDAL